MDLAITRPGNTRPRWITGPPWTTRPLGGMAPIAKISRLDKASRLAMIKCNGIKIPLKITSITDPEHH
jgi:hypothetical protein